VGANLQSSALQKLIVTVLLPATYEQRKLKLSTGGQ
jgi:hypothetical protein